MAILTQPAIATVAGVAQYAGMSNSDLSGTIADGTTTLSQYVQVLLNETAWLLKEWCDQDFTQTQTFEDIWLGNDAQYHIVDAPTFATGVTFSRFPVGSNKPQTVQTFFATTDIVHDVGMLNRIWIVPTGPSGLQCFSSGYIWTLRYTSDSITASLPPIYGTTTLGGWPMPIVQVQIEMVVIRIRESGIGWGGGTGTAALNAATGQLGMIDRLSLNNMPRNLHFNDMVPRWKRAIAPYKRISI